jgi:hypothetical protein
MAKTIPQAVREVCLGLPETEEGSSHFPCNDIR